MARPTRRALPLAILCLLSFAACVPVSLNEVFAAPPRFEVTFDKSVSDKPYTGRVYIVATSSSDDSPLDSVTWTSTEPFLAQDVENWQPGEVLRFDARKCVCYPCDLEQIPPDDYRAQAVMDLNGWTQDVIRGPGNGVSDVVRFTHDPLRPETVSFDIKKKLPSQHLTDSDEVKYVRLLSDRLTKFHGRYVHMHAAVALPDAYQRDPDRRFPTVYLIGGFGSAIREAAWYVLAVASYLDSAEFEAVVVYLDADAPTGHHVFADSANNGPCGAALVNELIPHLESRFRLTPEAGARFVTGASSGGWSGLWLQINYPDTFGGVWALSPDPVDFSAFQTVNIYDSKADFLHDSDGEPRRFSRGGMFGSPILVKDFARLEEVQGRGGQWYSFEAVFGPRGRDGRPARLWNRQTGRVDPRIAEAWKRYDIRLLLESRWAGLKSKLHGKLFLYCGDADDFYLELAFNKLSESLRKLGSDAYVELVPGAGHGLPTYIWRQAAEQMKALYESRYGRAGGTMLAYEGANQR